MLPEALDVLLTLTKVLGFALALAVLYLWVNVTIIHRNLKKIVLRWEKPEFGIVSLAIFIAMILILSGSLLSYAFYIRDVGRVLGAEMWLHLFVGLSGLLLLSGLAYLGLKLLYIQPIGEEGIYMVYFSRRVFLFQTNLITWSDVYDYFIQQGEFFSTIVFIARNGKQYPLRVPTYLVKTLSKLADYSIDKYAFLMKYGRKTSKSSRHN